MPHYSDYRSHVRLGDIAISIPTREDGTIYHHCEKALMDSPQRRVFTKRSWLPTDKTLQKTISQIRTNHERDPLSLTRPWERYLSSAIDVLSAEVTSFSRPPAKSDKLLAILDDHPEPVLLEHPRPLGTRQNKFYKENMSNIRYGPVASNKHVARNRQLRMEFAESISCVAYVEDSRVIMEELQKFEKNSFAFVCGTADYFSGRSNLDWQPHAALCAASMAKHVVSSLPSPGSKAINYFR